VFAAVISCVIPCCLQKTSIGQFSPPGSHLKHLMSHPSAFNWVTNAFAH
jgi:hypothetical protein